MKKIQNYFILLFGVMAILSSCKDENEDDKKDPQPGKQTCTLTKTVDDDGATSVFEYNANGDIAKMTDTDDGETDVYNYNYSANNKLESVSNTYNNETMVYKLIYKDGNINRIDVQDDKGKTEEYTNVSYNSAGKVNRLDVYDKEEGEPDMLYTSTTITYNGDNVSKAIEVEYDDEDTTTTTRTFISFDSKPNNFNKLNNWITNGFDMLSFSKNNVTKLELEFEGYKVPYNMTYTYNSSDYVTTAIFKFNAFSSTTNFTWDCK